MKKLFVLAIVAVTFMSCQNTNATSSATTESEHSLEVVDSAVVAPGEAAVINFENGNFNFGKITQGEKVSYSYKFKNVGTSPLIILDATATCGCTVPEVPKEPIKPGAEGEIKVVFDSNGKSGMQDKVITVTSNAQPQTATLHLTGEIIEQAN